MSTRKRLLVGAMAALAIGAATTPLAHAEPLTPLTPNEIKYLDGLRQIFAAKHDPTAFRSDGELLTRGQFVCAKASGGQIGEEATFQPAALTQLAFLYLCP